MTQHLKHRNIRLYCDIHDCCNSRVTDCTFGFIDDTRQPDGVRRVDNNGQVSDHILDFFSFEELGTAEQPVRNTRFNKILLDDRRLRVHPVEDGMVSVSHSLRHILFDGIGNELCFFPFILNLFQSDLVTGSVLSPEVFAFPANVMLNDLISGIEDGLGRTVVLFQPDDGRIAELVLKRKDVFNRRAAEFINTLVIIANDTKILALGCQQADQHILGMVGILILVHHQVPPTILVIFQHLGALLEKRNSLDDDIIKVQRIGSPHPPGIGFINFGDLLFAEIVSSLGKIISR